MRRRALEHTSYPESHFVRIPGRGTSHFLLAIDVAYFHITSRLLRMGMGRELGTGGVGATKLHPGLQLCIGHAPQIFSALLNSYTQSQRQAPGAARTPPAPSPLGSRCSGRATPSWVRGLNISWGTQAALGGPGPGRGVRPEACYKEYAAGQPGHTLSAT